MQNESLQNAIDEVRRYYDDHGIFMKKFGFGNKPALVVVDMAYGWTDPAYAGGSARLDEAVEAIARLLTACRAKNLPVVYTTAPFRPGREDPNTTRDEAAGRFRKWDQRACQIDERLQPRADELLIQKENASAFFGTHLAPYLIERAVDTVIVTGCSTSACVRATATDAKAYRFKPIVPRQAVQDRAAAAHEWNLFDINAKFGDVVDVDEVLTYLERLQN